MRAARFSLVPVFIVVAMVLVALCGCGSEGTEGERSVVSVYAASSLTESFRALEQAFETAHPGVDVQLTFAGSQILRLQIEQGASADVFASANAAHMNALFDSKHIVSQQIFARNAVVIIVPTDNPADIGDFAQLSRAKRLVIGTEHVPIGLYTRQILEKAKASHGEEFIKKVRSSIVSEESNARLVRAKVALGEADAALVYKTDAVSTQSVRSIPIPDPLGVVADYPIGLLAKSRNAAKANAFVDFVRSKEGRDILARHGFEGASR